MNALLVLIPVSVVLGVVGLCAFIWAMRHGQFEDPERDAWSVISPTTAQTKKGAPDDRMVAHADDSDATGRL